MPRRILQGTVVSDKGDKTVIVSVERRVMHPIYKKFIRRSKRYAAHDDDNSTRSATSCGSSSAGRSRAPSAARCWREGAAADGRGERRV